MTPTFLSPPTHYSIAEFRAHLSNLALGAWRPKFPTLHNTGVPSLKQWLAMGATPQERWGANLNRYYQGMGWHAGPHVVVCPDYVWALCDLTKSGVSVSCWNADTFGIEMVGDYEVGGDDFASGEGAKVRDNATALLAALVEKFGWGDLSDMEIGERGLHFHHECAADHHACPGSKVTKLDMLARIGSYLELPHGSMSLPTIAPANAPKIVEAERTISSVDDIQAALNQLGANPLLEIDGVWGSATAAAVRDFQSSHHCFVDGWAGPRTLAAIEAAMGRVVSIAT